MEDSLLNMAHYQNRRADSHTRYGRFEEAIRSHEMACKYLTEATKLTLSKEAKESLLLQRKYHLRQIELVHIKSQHYERFQIALEATKKDPELKQNTLLDKTCDLQMAIYKTLEQSDEYLRQIEGNIEQKTTISSAEMQSGDKEGEKDRKVTNTSALVNLKAVNQKLNVFVYQLIAQMDENVQETLKLREKVKELDAKLKDNSANSAKAEFQTQSNDDVESSFGLSESHSSSNEDLPKLAPLELPKFDFENFDCNLEN